jgi:P27 family predicted phage terminase small subunit
MPARTVPTKIKAAKGTLRKDRTNFNEPNYLIVREIPDPPEYLDEVGRKVYYSTAEELLRLGLLTNISLPLFVIYCVEISRYYEALKQLSTSPLIIKGTNGGDPKPNPWIKIANTALLNATKLAGEFGITPATSGKVSVKKTESLNEDKWLKRKLKSK